MTDLTELLIVDLWKIVGENLPSGQQIVYLLNDLKINEEEKVKIYTSLLTKLDPNLANKFKILNDKKRRVGYYSSELYHLDENSEEYKKKLNSIKTRKPNSDVYFYLLYDIALLYKSESTLDAFELFFSFRDFELLNLLAGHSFSNMDIYNVSLLNDSDFSYIDYEIVNRYFQRLFVDSEDGTVHPLTDRLEVKENKELFPLIKALATEDFRYFPKLYNTFGKKIFELYAVENNYTPRLMKILEVGSKSSNPIPFLRDYTGYLKSKEEISESHKKWIGDLFESSEYKLLKAKYDL